MTEDRKYAILFAATSLCTRKLMELDSLLCRCRRREVGYSCRLDPKSQRGTSRFRYARAGIGP